MLYVFLLFYLFVDHRLATAAGNGTILVWQVNLSKTSRHVNEGKKGATIVSLEVVYRKNRLTFFLSPGQMSSISFNIVELDFVGWCWTAQPNECNMLCGAESNCGD